MRRFGVVHVEDQLALQRLRRGSVVALMDADLDTAVRRLTELVAGATAVRRRVVHVAPAARLNAWLHPTSPLGADAWVAMVDLNDVVKPVKAAVACLTSGAQWLWSLVGRPCPEARRRGRRPA